VGRRAAVKDKGGSEVIVLVLVYTVGLYD